MRVQIVGKRMRFVVAWTEARWLWEKQVRFVRVRAEARWLWGEWMRVQIVAGEWEMFVTAWWL